MNVKRVLAIIMVALVACLIFTGVASAFSYQSSDYSVNPKGSLVPGAEVTASMLVSYPTGSAFPNQLNLDSQLVGVSWTVVKNPGTAGALTFHPVYPYDYLSNFDIYETSSAVSLLITVKGTVSSDSAGKELIPLTISESGGSNSVFTSPTQFVYDTGNLAGNLQTLSNEISSLESTINEYTTAGYDCSAAKANLETARAKYQAAVSAGTEDGIAAFTNYENGMAALDKAKQSLAYISLKGIVDYTSKIDVIVTELKSNGWNNEATNVDTKNSIIKLSYESLYSAYLAESVNMGEINKLRVEVIDLYNEASKYLEDSQNPLGGLLGILPIIGIVVGVIVVGVIVFFIIRKRKSSWDELG